MLVSPPASMTAYAKKRYLTVDQECQRHYHDDVLYFVDEKNCCSRGPISKRSEKRIISQCLAMAHNKH